MAKVEEKSVSRQELIDAARNLVLDDLGAAPAQVLTDRFEFKTLTYVIVIDNGIKGCPKYKYTLEQLYNLFQATSVPLEVLLTEIVPDEDEEPEIDLTGEFVPGEDDEDED